MDTGKTSPREGRVVLVTGAGNGLGRAYAERLGARGMAVAVADVDGDAAERVAAAIAAAGGRAAAFTADVADPTAVERLGAGVEAELGPVAVLVNNAGGSFHGPMPMEEYTPAQFAKVLAVNLTGTWLCCQAVVPGMKAAGGGRIVNVSSATLGRGEPAGIAPYIAAKGGVVGLTRALARELGPDGIAVNAIAPGFIALDKLAPGAPRAAALGEIAARVREQQCLPRDGAAADLLGALELLVSEESGFITGQVINVDGGWSLV